MTERDRLADLLANYDIRGYEKDPHGEWLTPDDVADHLIAAGVGFHENSHTPHFNPDCEECAYLARPTRETLTRADLDVERLARAATKAGVDLVRLDRGDIRIWRKDGYEADDIAAAYREDAG